MGREHGHRVHTVASYCVQIHTIANLQSLYIFTFLLLLVQHVLYGLLTHFDENRSFQRILHRADKVRLRRQTIPNIV